jgi:hypothetical protein
MASTPQVFTLEAANALLPRLKALIEGQMERRSEIEGRLERLGELLGTVPETLQPGDADPPAVRDLKRDLTRRVEAYQSVWREVEELGAVLKDPGQGLVDFYGRVDEKLVWFCWRFGEEAVTHYHELDEGFAGRKPIEDTMRRRHLN